MGTKIYDGGVNKVTGGVVPAFGGEFLRPWPRLSLHFCPLIVGRASRCANARFACTPRNAQFPESQITSSPASSFVKIAMHGTRILRCYPVVRRIVQR